MAFNSHGVINGTHGTLWINDKEIGEVKAFQCKVEFEKEDIKMCGDMATHTKVVGYSIKGSVTVHKISSKMCRFVVDSLKSGKEARATIISKLADPDSDGTERVAIKNVSFDDLTVADWEAGTPGTSEHPFTATSIEYLDMI